MNNHYEPYNRELTALTPVKSAKQHASRCAYSGY
ncbi:hypothetical protein Pvag_pPag30306 (plasmid) [Pantoea vagans C9-1]|nr:hypothetical protein Pvag_pPag30306 [Pantoea vagans C9-1]